MLDLVFGSKIGQWGLVAIGVFALAAWWQIDRHFVAKAGERTGRLEQRLKTQEKANEQVERAAAARDRARASRGRLRIDPGYTGD